MHSTLPLLYGYSNPLIASEALLKYFDSVPLREMKGEFGVSLRKAIGPPRSALPGWSILPSFVSETGACFSMIIHHPILKRSQVRVFSPLLLSVVMHFELCLLFYAWGTMLLFIHISFVYFWPLKFVKRNRNSHTRVIWNSN
jgi:hypothetical protein